MFRLLLILIVVFAASVWIEPRWNPEGREVVLRVRESNELLSVVRRHAVTIGKRMVEAMGDDVPPVSSPGPASSSSQPADELTQSDRNALDRLIERKLKENERGLASGEN